MFGTIAAKMQLVKYQRNKPLTENKNKKYKG
jgi:hypothetical protein